MCVSHCGVLQFIAACYSGLHCVAVCCSVLQYVALCCSVLQCVAVCCSVLQCVHLSTRPNPAWLDAHKQSWMRTQMYTCTQVCKFIHIKLHTCTYMYVHISIFMYIKYIYRYIYKYTTHTCRPPPLPLCWSTGSIAPSTLPCFLHVCTWVSATFKLHTYMCT